MSLLIQVLLISLPEEIFLAIFTLNLMKQFQFLETKQESATFTKLDYLLLSVPIVLTIIVSNFVRFTTHDYNLTVIISMVVMFLAILFSYQLYRNFKEAARTLITTVASFIILMLIEFSYVPIFLYVTHKTVLELNSDSYFNFLCTLPERLIEGAIIVYVFTKKVAYLRANVLKPIMESRFLSITTSVVLLFNVSLLLLLGKIILFDKALDGLTLYLQVYICVGILLLVLGNLFAYFIGIYYVSDKNSLDKFLYGKTIHDFAENIQEYAREGKHDKIEAAAKNIITNAELLYKDQKEPKGKKKKKKSEKEC